MFSLVGQMFSYRRITPSTTTALHGIQNPSHPVFEEIWDVSDGIAVREKVPASSTVSVVIEPGAEDKISRGGEESAEQKVSSARRS
tara:strand:- start:70 stop:327 length:258 start_codon:yes stop_codon:yes gene_type:complete